MRSGLMPGGQPVRRLVGRWKNARCLVCCGDRDGRFGLYWMIW